MVGPTGCGKTEIARRIAKLCQAPFIKVEATKFTEVGFHGKDVDQIIVDLVEISINMTKKRISEEIKDSVVKSVEEKLVNALIGESADQRTVMEHTTLLQQQLLEDISINIDVPNEKSQEVSLSTVLIITFISCRACT
jgi:ATP-dependent HslUV protease ATP-binding subunit HslU